MARGLYRRSGRIFKEGSRGWPVYREGYDLVDLIRGLEAKTLLIVKSGPKK